LLFYKTRSQLALLLALERLAVYTPVGKTERKQKITIYFGDQIDLLFGWSTHSVSD
jgi:hypothetical protein